MGLKRKITVVQFDGGYQIISPVKSGSDGPDGVYVSDPGKKLDFDALIEKLKWIDEHKDKALPIE